MSAPQRRFDFGRRSGLALLSGLAPWSGLAPIALAGIFSSALTLISGVGNLGYFAALPLTPFAAIAGTFLGLRAARLRAGTLQQSQRSNNAAQMSRDVALLSLAMVTPLASAQWWNPSCDLATGAGFFVLGPVISAIAGWSCGKIAGDCWPHRKWRSLIAFLPMTVTTVVGVVRLLRGPALFYRDLFWGYFAGPIYDESVGIDSALLRSRFAHLLAIGGFWLARSIYLTQRTNCESPRPPAQLTAWTIACALLIAPSVWPERFGLHPSAATLQEHLSSRLETEHFILHAPQNISEHELLLLAAEHEFAWQLLAQQLDVSPAYKFTSYLFESTTEKQALTGAGRTEVSLPWRGELYLNPHDFPHAVLHHELAHAFALAVDPEHFGVSMQFGVPNGALIEGFATALAPRSYNELALHDQAATLDRLEKRPPLSDIMSIGFWLSPSSRAYVSAGSFCRWLLETRGPIKFRELYRTGGDTKRTYGESLDELESQWILFLRSRTLAPEDIDAMRQRFRTSSVFERPCAHRVSRLFDEYAVAWMNDRYGDAQNVAKELCRLAPEEARHHLALARADIQLGEVAQARQDALQALEIAEVSPQERASVFELLGDLELEQHRYTDAIRNFELARASESSLGGLRTLQVKVWLSQTASRYPQLVQAARSYFEPNERKLATKLMVRLDAAMQIRDVPELAAIGNYLIARVLLSASQPERVRTTVELAIFPPAGAWSLPSRELLLEAGKMRLKASVLSSNWAAAHESVAWLKHQPDLGSGTLAELDLWEKRIAFYQEYIAHHPATTSRR